jgi:hypothetical protein
MTSSIPLPGTGRKRFQQGFVDLADTDGNTGRSGCVAMVVMMDLVCRQPSA